MKCKAVKTVIVAGIFLEQSKVKRVPVSWQQWGLTLKIQYHFTNAKVLIYSNTLHDVIISSQERLWFI